MVYICSLCLGSQRPGPPLPVGAPRPDPPLPVHSELRRSKMSVSGSDSDIADGSRCPSAISSASVITSKLPVHIAENSKLQCKLCQAKVGDPSPLRTSDPADQYGGRRPWGKYKKVRGHDGGHKIPQGRICGICHNVYRALGAIWGLVQDHIGGRAQCPAKGPSWGCQGCVFQAIRTISSKPLCLPHVRSCMHGRPGYHMKHGPHSQYLAHCSQSGRASEHQGFMRSVQKFIDKHNDEPNSTRLRARAELLQAQTSLETQRSSGTRRMKNMTFIHVDSWDASRYGDYEDFNRFGCVGQGGRQSLCSELLGR